MSSLVAMAMLVRSQIVVYKGHHRDLIHISLESPAILPPTLIGVGSRTKTRESLQRNKDSGWDSSLHYSEASGVRPLSHDSSPAGSQAPCFMKICHSPKQ